MPVNSPTASITSKVHLSRSEIKVLDLLPLADETTTKNIAEAYYGGNIPHNGQIVITNIVRSLEKKTKRTPWRVKRGTRNGPHPITVQLKQAI